MTSSTISAPPSSEISLRWLAPVLRVAGAILAILPFLPPLLRLAGNHSLGERMDGWFEGFCHRLPERSFSIGSEMMPLCSRCLGISTGAGLGLLIGRPYWGLRALRIWVSIAAALNKYNIYAIASGDDSVLQSMKQKEPKRILPSKLIWSPKAVDMAQLRQEIKDKKWDAIGELLSQYATLPANDPSLDPLYSLAEEMDIPVGIHMGPGPMGAAYIPMFKGYRMSLTHPFYLEDVLIKHPKLRLYVMHAGYPMIDEMLGMLYDFPQLYVGIAAIDWIFPNRKEFYRYLKTLVDAGYEKRILFGSDEMEWPQGIGMAIKNVQEAPFLTESEKRDILFNNAVRFFKLNPADFRNN